MNHLHAFGDGTVVHDNKLPSGLQMRWYEKGAGGDLPTAILLHGFPELAVSWRHQFAGLSPQVRLVAPDMRGYGGTDAPARVRDYAMHRLVEDVVGLADTLGESRVHLVGHDWGGAVAWEVARQAPERLHSLAVLNCPPVDMMTRALVNPGQVKRSWYIFFFQLPWLPERWMTRDADKLVQASMRGTAANKEPFTREVLAPYVQQVRERGLPGINYYRAALRRWPVWKHCRVEVPTQLIWGLSDPFLGPWFAEPERYRRFVPDFDLVTIPDAAHWVQQEAAPQVNEALLGFWQRVKARALS